MPTYVVECYWPEITEKHAQDALTGIIRSQVGVDTPDQVRPIGGFLVASDGMAFFLFAAPSAVMIEAAAETTELPFDRIVESVPITLWGCQHPTVTQKPG